MGVLLPVYPERHIPYGPEVFLWGLNQAAISPLFTGGSLWSYLEQTLRIAAIGRPNLLMHRHINKIFRCI